MRKASRRVAFLQLFFGGAMTNCAWPNLGPRARFEARRFPVVLGAVPGLTLSAEVVHDHADDSFAAAFADEID